VTLSLVP